MSDSARADAAYRDFWAQHGVFNAERTLVDYPMPVGWDWDEDSYE